MSDLGELKARFHAEYNHLTPPVLAYVVALEAEVERLTKERDAAETACRLLREAHAKVSARVPDPDDLRMVCDMAGDVCDALEGEGMPANLARAAIARLRATLEEA